MEIEPNRHIRALQRSKLTRKGKLSPDANQSVDNAAEGAANLTIFNELVDRLSQLSDMREEILEEARNLLKDPNYPSRNQLEELELAIARRQKHS